MSAKPWVLFFTLTVLIAGLFTGLSVQPAHAQGCDPATGAVCPTDKPRKKKTSTPVPPVRGACSAVKF